MLAEHDIDLPATSWELRTSGLWADHICEAPLDHWSYGLESFALVIDDAWDPPVTRGVRLVSVVDDDIQHAGQAAYLAGLARRRRS